ncbi:MAG TPA: aminoacyl-tRNA hydrolase [Candidatus Saccharimonadales bacterium]|nr:aminoacyl-tRNA hydrolase [Candidatus Saccharimonadales bacterium]
MPQKIKLIVGLGNIGQMYQGTRHNVGFICLDEYAAEHSLVWQERPKFDAFVAETQQDDNRLVCIKPTTYMNNSGKAVRAIKDFYKLDNGQILVVHDELDLPFGTIRTRLGGSHAGNKGVLSVSQSIGEDFLRIRCGIANEQSSSEPAEQFVLARFNPEEMKQMDSIKSHVASLIDKFLNDSLLADTAKV